MSAVITLLSVYSSSCACAVYLLIGTDFCFTDVKLQSAQLASVITYIIVYLYICLYRSVSLCTADVTRSQLYGTLLMTVPTLSCACTVHSAVDAALWSTSMLPFTCSGCWAVLVTRHVLCLNPCNRQQNALHSKQALLSAVHGNAEDALLCGLCACCLS